MALDALSMCSSNGGEGQFACQDPSRAVLNGIYPENAETGCRMVTADGKRLTC